MSLRLQLCVIMLGLGLAFSALAESPSLQVEANASFWILFKEEVENGIVQAGSNDDAVEEASGFNFKQGRIGFLMLSPDKKYEGLIRLRLEERTDVIDFWGAYHYAPWLNAYIGQMKIPSTFEVLQRDHMTDFISRTTFAQNVGDFALAKTPYISSLMNTKSHNRDLGLSVKGTIPYQDRDFVRYFIMVSNGTGAGNYIGGKESSEVFYTNKLGDFHYGARLEVCPLPWVTLGAHASRNIHNDSILQDKKTTVDLERQVWSADIQVTTPWGTRLSGFYGEGWMDDYFNSTDYEFDYSGWGIWLVQGFQQDKYEVGLRYDNFTTEFMDDDNEVEQNNFTAGLNYRPSPYVRFQLNYIWKDTVDEYEDDLKDDIVYMNVQFMFDRWFTDLPGLPAR